MHDGHLYMKILKGMYGLPQSGILAYKQLVNHLKSCGYEIYKCTQGLWTHRTNCITLTIFVDNYGIKYTDRATALHLLDALKAKYTISTDWEVKLYCGLTLYRNYKQQTVTISIPNYVSKYLHIFHDQMPKQAEDSPYPDARIQYDAKTQYIDEQEQDPILSTKDKTKIQQIVGNFLFYAQAVDATMLTALNEFSGQQSKPTANTASKMTQFINYFATHPEARIQYHASNMILYVHSDTGYLNSPKARSRAGGNLFLSNKQLGP